MFLALNWAMVLILLATWSLAAWAFHSIAAWVISGAGVLADGSEALEVVPTPDVLAAWEPAELLLALSAVQSQFVPVISGLLERAPGLADGLSLVPWTIWGAGAALIVLLGVVSSALILSLGSASLPWKR